MQYPAKRILYLVLSLAFMTGVVGYITTAITASPLDTASSWASEGINEAIKKGFVPPDLQNNYTDNITRQEFCRMAVKWLEYATSRPINTLLTDKGLFRDTNAFTDTNDSDILAAFALGISSGAGNNRFDPDGAFSREQAATMIMNTVRALGVDITNPLHSNFADLSTASSWAIDGIHFVSANGIMQGTGNNFFSPHSVYTREQSILTFNNIDLTRTPTITPTPTPPPTHTITPTPIPTSITPTWSNISIIGDFDFIKHTQDALILIQAKSTRIHTLVNNYIAIIEQSAFSGMRAIEALPTFQVGTLTYTSSTTWYASCIVHDAYHSKLYYDALEQYGYVADDKWTGDDAEKLCLMVQIEFLIEIGAPRHEINWAISLTGANWWDDVVVW